MVGILESENNRDDDFDNFGLGCALEMFSEVDDVVTMIENLKNIYNTRELEGQYDKLYSILKQYYEQPHLLDPHLEKILNKLIDIIRDSQSPNHLKHATFTYMYQIIRVRGYKVVVRHLPHEVTDLQDVLTFLESLDPNDKTTWWSRFVLLLWLSIIVMIPFHMSRLDGFSPGDQDADGNKKKGVMERIFNICQTYALVTDACSEAGAFLTSKFLTRSDVKDIYLGAFFDWSCQLHSNIREESTIRYGLLAAVASVLKHGKREDMLPHATPLLEWVTQQNYTTHKAILVRKYGVKIVQRLGLTYLKPRLVAWRYTRGSRSLAANLGAVPAAGGDQAEEVLPMIEDDDQDIPEQVEEVVELLLVGLRDEDRVVRWSAAKGLGRVGARLPPIAAADVCSGALALFAPRERDHTWHGACMALAELARRGLLSPPQLSAGVRAVVGALRRDEARGEGGGGGARAARDAACHASWAFARAYPGTALAPHALALANALVATACYDREINCRRAASAAYQENVGRHGQFPHGIEVLTTADFHEVGPRNNAYLVVAPSIACFPEYTQPLVDHLVELKVDHWDCAIRELAAKALHKLTDKIPKYIAETVLPILVTKTQSNDLNMRHGAILALGEAIFALSLVPRPEGGTFLGSVSTAVIDGVRELVPRLYSKQQFRGLGGELMRQACCECIRNLSLAGVQFHGDAVIDDWLNLLEDCLCHEVQQIRSRAIAALPYVFRQYLEGPLYTDKRKELLDKYCAKLKSEGGNGLVARMGYTLAVGSLPKFALQENLPTVMSSLIECTRVTEATPKWAESRRDAVRGLTQVCVTVGFQFGGQGGVGINEYVDTVFDALLACLNEYTVDMRGDIGAWVREASLTGLLSLCRLCARCAPDTLSASHVRGAVTGAAQQAVEKIDRTRAHAAKIFTALLHNVPSIPHIPHHEEIKSIFPLEECHLSVPTAEIRDGVAEQVESAGKQQSLVAESESNSSTVLWLFPGHTMPRFVKLLDYQEYRYSIMLGLTVSGGDLTESLVKHATSSLFAYLTSLHSDLDKLATVCDTLVDVFARNQRHNRITVPIFNFIDRILSSGSISPILEDPNSKFAGNILTHVKLELRGCKNMYKKLDSINVLCQLIQVGGSVCTQALGQLVICLCYADRYVRRFTAGRLYEALVIYGDISVVPPDNLDQVMCLLAETDWEQEVTELKSIRNEMCHLMGIKCPVPVPKTPSKVLTS